MQRILMASADSAELEWFTEEMRDARIVGKIQSLEFFIQQWQSVQADTCIVTDNVMDNEELLLNHVLWLQEQETLVKIFFIHFREAEDEFIRTLMAHDIVCVHYDKLEPGTVEETIRALTNGDTEFHYVNQEETSQQEEAVLDDTEANSTLDALDSPPCLDVAKDYSDEGNAGHEGGTTAKKNLLDAIPFLANRTRRAPESQIDAHEEEQIDERLEAGNREEVAVIQEANSPEEAVIPKKEKKQLKVPIPKKQREQPQQFTLPATLGTYTVGVAGISGRVGTTTIALQAAAFLVKQGLKVAVCELPKNDPVFWKLSFDRKIPFVVDGIYLYPKCENFIDIMYSNQYDVVILDVGSVLENKSLSPVAYEFVRLHKKILTTSPGVWDMDKLMDTIQLLQEKNFLSKTDIVVNPSDGNGSAVAEVLTKKHCTELDVRLFHMGIITDPFQINGDSIINYILRG